MNLVDRIGAAAVVDVTGEGEVTTGLPRAFDVIVALFGLMFVAPLLFVCALAVALTSRGGVFFRQKRVGLNGNIFTLYKLRTMRVANGGPQVTSANDARVTRLGRFLRQTKLDELPTLWNVLKGDMALVGPRPEVPRYVNLDDPKWQKVLQIKPGITDPVTVSLRNEESLLARIEGNAEDFYVNELQALKLRGYLAYFEKRSWQSDLKVLAHTLWAIVSERRA